jgi:hypothetical protein
MGGQVKPNPYWERAIQYQQRQQGQQHRQQQGRLREDFGDDWRGRHVVTKVVEGSGVNIIEGVVEDVSRYWLKVRVGNETLYINKAHVISIKPLEVKEPADGGSNADK